MVSQLFNRNSLFLGGGFVLTGIKTVSKFGDGHLASKVKGTPAPTEHTAAETGPNKKQKTDSS